MFTLSLYLHLYLFYILNKYIFIESFTDLTTFQTGDWCGITVQHAAWAHHHTKQPAAGATTTKNTTRATECFFVKTKTIYYFHYFILFFNYIF
jgi:hypothetical protein